MRHSFHYSQRLLVPLCLLLVLAALTPVAADSIWACVEQVDMASYQHYLDDLLYTRLGHNRGVGGREHDLARDNIYSEFAAFGLETSLDPFKYNGRTYHNVVGVLPGTTRADEVYVLGAHYDSVNNPGADDNASGVAGMLEAARILSQYESEATIIFIAFDREEQGMIGSTAWVNNNLGMDIRGMVTMDMIAYNPSGANKNTAAIYGRTASSSWKNSLAAAIQTYGGLNAYVGGELSQSDHAPFEARGYQACLLIERMYNSNPYYHRLTDSVDTPNYIDYLYATKMTRGTVGLLAEQAGVQTPEAGTVILFGTCLVALGRKMRSVRRRRRPPVHG